MDVKIKKETFKLRAFTDDSVLTLETLLKAVGTLMGKLKEFGTPVSLRLIIKR